MSESFCPRCFELQKKNDRLEDENKRLKDELRRRKKKSEEGPFGSSTPSAKVPLKANSSVTTESKKLGARFGHKGVGRKSFDEEEADSIVRLSPEVGDVCPDCGGVLESKGSDTRLVLDLPEVRTRKILYETPHHYCPRCRRSFRPRPGTVLPRSLYGNQLVATATTMHYLHGIPMGRICAQLGLPSGSLAGIFHQLADAFANAQDKLIEWYRKSPVRHADETGWRTRGKNGYAWAFVTEYLSLFFFLRTRSASVPKMVFGTEPLGGSLNVDRYAAYNVAMCLLQYCYAHLLRLLSDAEKDFPDSEEVRKFVNFLAPLLAMAISLRTMKISDEEFYAQAATVKKDILLAVNSDAQHQAVRSFQDIFRANHHRLYLWADNRAIPADNNRAERDLRPIVIARKVSHGSQSDKGAHTRGILSSLVHTLRKQKLDPTRQIKSALDSLALNPPADAFSLLFPHPPTLH